LKAMVLDSVKDLSTENEPLDLAEVEIPILGKDDVLLKVLTCGVCHTELDEIEGRTPPSVYPMIPGHQVVSVVEETGSDVKTWHKGDRVGVAWIYSSCGSCEFCRTGLENLCSQFKATGRDAHGGYAEYLTVNQEFVNKIPTVFSDSEAAPLLCAGAIGYRSLALTGLDNGQNLGLTGFGASAHLVLKMAKFNFPDSKIYVFARSEKEREFAMELGAEWAGETVEHSPDKLHAIIDTTPVWFPVVKALENLAPGGRLVINAIRKENIDSEHLRNIDYPKHLWLEKEIKSVANVARSDVAGFLQLAADMQIKPEYQEYSLEEANIALLELKNRKIRGAKVLRISQ